MKLKCFGTDTLYLLITEASSDPLKNSNGDVDGYFRTSMWWIQLKLNVIHLSVLEKRYVDAIENKTCKKPKSLSTFLMKLVFVYTYVKIKQLLLHFIRCFINMNTQFWIKLVFTFHNPKIAWSKNWTSSIYSMITHRIKYMYQLLSLALLIIVHL